MAPVYGSSARGRRDGSMPPLLDAATAHSLTACVLLEPGPDTGHGTCSALLVESGQPVPARE